MTGNPDIYITEFDLKRLRELLRLAKVSHYRGRDDLKKLAEELDRSKVVPPQEIPCDVVTMNSRVRLTDLESGEETTFTLVFPEDADLEQHRISVVAPIGTAMLGYRVGNIFEWQVPEGVRRLQIKEILYQPEASGDYQL